VVMQIDRTQLLCETTPCHVVDVGKHQLRSFARENTRTGGPDARCGARDDPDFSIELTHGVLPCFRSHLTIPMTGREGRNSDGSSRRQGDLISGGERGQGAAAARLCAAEGARIVIGDVLEARGGGSIVNISSVAGLRGSPGAIAYITGAAVAID